ncbi:MAG: ribosome biogenesis GTP-binding protein YihA/YsxC [Microscillaceae bacterium]|nr:ribosome biogenesis GTP-binding protein YihA/YsxC [Microscillaceae bacterium]MDW8461669.1 ribosome biogenesis GTP-binding protein YihA/YsxC [Cytophagales bacterium]
MWIKKAVFVKSSKSIRQCPPADKPEFAFIGRSNVGKSSLINRLTNHKGLAKTSQTPGKTQLINHFLIDDSWFLVDLPGYGYAKVGKEQRTEFENMIKTYLAYRSNLYCVLVLIDSRLEPQKNDLTFLEWLGTNQIPFVIVFTKADKNSKTKLQHNIELFKQKLSETWEELPQMFITSSETGEGCEELGQFLIEVQRNGNQI